MKIFYFTSTGNCLEVAKKLGGELISIPKVLNSNEFEFKDDVIGIITPNYQGDIPAPVKEFINKANLKADYFFGIVTYGAFNSNTNENLLMAGESNGIKFNYINDIVMVDNSFVYFDMEKQINNLPKKKVDEHIEKIKADIDNRINKINNVNITRRIVGKVIGTIENMIIDKRYHNKFYVEDTCIKCGICEKVCPINNITIENKPIIHDKCIRCGACTHNCSKNSIRFKGEKSRARYRNVNVTLAEIIKSNSK